MAKYEEGNVKGQKLALVTGGAGFIGSNLVIYLLENGFHIRVLDNLSTGNIKNLEGFLNEIEFLHGDICKKSIVKESIKKVDYVFHQAALPSVPRSIKDPYSTNKVNIEGTLNLLLAAKEAGVKRFIYASSSSVYGNGGILPREEAQPVEPASPYALSKYTGERYCQIFYELYGLETVCLRYFNVFGPNQNADSQYAAVIPKFIKQIKKGEPVTIYGDGSQTRDFTYVQNVTFANLLAAEAQGVAGEIFNIASGKEVSVAQLANLLIREIGINVQIEHLPERKGEVKHSLANINKARKLLNYKILVDFEGGIKKTISTLNI